MCQGRFWFGSSVGKGGQLFLIPVEIVRMLDVGEGGLITLIETADGTSIACAETLTVGAPDQ
jgi:hypothetical protein